jgi:hypothetical protein
MFRDFAPRLTGNNAELVVEMEKLVRPLAEFDYGPVATGEVSGHQPEKGAENAQGQRRR